MDGTTIHKTPSSEESPPWFPASLGWDLTMKILEDNPAVGGGLLTVLRGARAEREC